MMISLVKIEMETAAALFLPKNIPQRTPGVAEWILVKAGSVGETVAINDSSQIIHNLLIVALLGKQSNF